MPDFNPYGFSNDETNPYAPPTVSLEGAPYTESPDLAKAEAMRRHYLNHEASVQSVGALYLLGAIFGVIVTVVALYFAFAGEPGLAPGEPAQTGLMLFVAVFYGGLTALFSALGIGLRRLKNWARGVVAILTGLNVAVSLLYLAVFTFLRPEPIIFLLASIGLLIPVYILYLLVSPKGAMVFSPEYRHVIEQTPHIKYKTGCLVKWLLVVFLCLILVSIVIGILGAFLR